MLAAETVMVQCAETDDAEFSFDHAFRQFEGFLESRQNDQVALEARDDPLGVVVDSPVDMIDRMGSADGEILVDVETLGEETNEKLGDFEEFLRNLEDQHAVEAQDFSQFSMSWPKKLSGQNKRKPIPKRKIETVPKFNTINRDAVEQRTINENEYAEVTTEKMSRKNDGDDEVYVFDPLHQNKQFLKKSLPHKQDMSHYPKEHRRQGAGVGRENTMAGMMNKARSVILQGTNSALQSNNVGTYLSTMWISNLMQTVGFSMLGMMASSASSGRRSGQRSSRGRGRAMNFSEDEHDEDDEVDNAFDIKSMTSMLRRIADLADTLHDEL